MHAHRVTNPHEFDVDGVTFLGTSGQNLDDIDRCGARCAALVVSAMCLLRCSHCCWQLCC